MKRFLLIYFFSIIAIIAQGQGISIELSVKWKKTKSQFYTPLIERDTVVFVPYLRLTYRNFTEKNIYVKKYGSNNPYPPVVWTTLINTSMDLEERSKHHSTYEDEFHKILISEVWEVMTQDNYISRKEEQELDVINDELWEIHTILKMQQLLNKLVTNKQLSSFRYPNKKVISYKEAQRLILNKGVQKMNFSSVEGSNLSEEDIRKQFSNEFVFLNRGEVYEEEVSLIGFYLLGGEFEFLISDNILKGHIIGKNGQKVILPKYVSGYQLYEGTFFTNTVGIKLPLGVE